MKKKYAGINIQWPISRQILSGEKKVETRTYSIPKKYLGQELVLIETPGPNGNFKARAIAIIRFTNCFEYCSKKDFYSDVKRHLVTPDSIWAWKDKTKWGWEVDVIKILPHELDVDRHGIVFRTGLYI